MSVEYVRMVVPRVVAQVADLLGLTVQEEATPMTVHPTNSLTIRQRVQAVNALADTIQAHPSAWGVWPDNAQRHLFASRLLELRGRIESCAIREAAEEAAL